MPTLPMIPLMIMCAGGFTPIMRGLIANSFYFDGKDMTSVICYNLGRGDSFESESHSVEVKGDEVAKCKPGYGIKTILIFIEEDKTLNKFQLTCQKLNSDMLVPGANSTVENQGVALDCKDQNVMTGLEAKRDGDRYIVTAHCQQLKAATTTSTTTEETTTTTEAPTTTEPPTSTSTEPAVTTVMQPRVTVPDITIPTIIPTAPTIPVPIECSNGMLPIMRGLVAKSFFFDGEPMTSVICYALGATSPYEGEKHFVQAKGDEVGNCKPGYGIISIVLYVEEDKTLQKFDLICGKLKSEFLDSGETSKKKNSGQELDCKGQNVMMGLEAKRNRLGYIVTAHCQPLKATKAQPTGFG